LSKKIVHNYTFTPASNKIVIDDVISQNRFLLITNMEDGKTIYTFNSPTASFASYTLDTVNRKTAVILDYDCSSMSSTDKLQIFIEHDGNLIQPGEAYTDPVSKLRVSNPQNLIDTDFEYGLQSTKWETVELVKNIPTFFSRDGDTGLIISSITATSGSKEITVNVTEEHSLSIGAPIIIIGTTLNLANGAFVVRSAPTSTSFTYMAKQTALSSGTISDTATQVFFGSIYQGTEFKLDGLDAISTDADSTGSVAGGSTITVKTKEDTKFNVGTSFYMTNSLGTSEITFNAATVTTADSALLGMAIDSSGLEFSFAHDSSLSGHRRADGMQPYAVLGATEFAVPNGGITGDSADPVTKYYNPSQISINTGTNTITLNNHGLTNRQAYLIVPGIGNTIGAGIFDQNFWGSGMDSAGDGILYVRIVDNNSFQLSTRNPVWTKWKDGVGGANQTGSTDSNSPINITSSTVVDGQMHQVMFIPAYRTRYMYGGSGDNSYFSFERAPDSDYAADGGRYTGNTGSYAHVSFCNPNRPPNWMLKPIGENNKQAFIKLWPSYTTYDNYGDGASWYVNNTGTYGSYDYKGGLTRPPRGYINGELNSNHIMYAGYSSFTKYGSKFNIGSGGNGYYEVYMNMASAPNSGKVNTGTINMYSTTNFQSTKNSFSTIYQNAWWVPVDKQDDWSTIYKNNHGLISGAPYSYDSVAQSGGGITKSHDFPLTGRGYETSVIPSETGAWNSGTGGSSIVSDVTSNSFRISQPIQQSNFGGYLGRQPIFGSFGIGSNRVKFKQPARPVAWRALNLPAGNGQTWHVGDSNTLGGISDRVTRGNGNPDLWTIPLSNHDIPEGSSLLYDKDSAGSSGANKQIGGLSQGGTYYANVKDTNTLRLSTGTVAIYPAGYNKHTGVQASDTRYGKINYAMHYRSGFNYFVAYGNDAAGFFDGDIVQYNQSGVEIYGLIPGAFYQVRQLYNGGSYNYDGHFWLSYYDRTADYGPGGDLAWTPVGTLGMSSYSWTASNYLSAYTKQYQNFHFGRVPTFKYYSNSSVPIGDFRHTNLVKLDSAGTGTQILNNTTIGAADGVYSVDSATDSKTYKLKAGAKIPKRALSLIGNEAVDVKNNSFHYNNHGFLTGTSVVYSTSGNKIIGLDSDTTYYAINQGKDTFLLATDSSNAQSGTALDITNANNTDTQIFTTSSISGQSTGPGTVSTISGSVKVTGSSTLFQSKYSPGDEIRIDRAADIQSITLASVTHGTETLTTNGSQDSTWAAGEALTVTFSTTMPTGLDSDIIYYAGSISTNAFKLYPTDSDAVAETNGPIAFSSAGSGTGTVKHRRGLQTYKEGTVKYVNNNTSVELDEAVDSDLTDTNYLVNSSFLMRADGFALHRPYDGGVELIPSTNPDGQMIRQTRRYFRYQSGKGIQNSLAINFSPSTDVDTFAADSSVGTITTRFGHRLSDDLRVTFKGATVSSGLNLFNESYKVLSRPTDNTFKIQFDKVLTLNTSHSGLTVGETITQTNSGALGLVRGDSSTVPAGNTIQLYDTEGTFTTNAADSCTGSTTGALGKYPSSIVLGPASSPAGGIITYSVDAWENSTLRAGLFDDQNGLFWEYDGSTLFAVVRSSTQQISGTAAVTFGSQAITGVNSKWASQLVVGDKIIIKGQTYKVVTISSNSAVTILPSYRGKSNNNCILTKTVDNRVPQSEFNLDPADGTGPTGFVFDKTKIQMTYIDYSWYGAGKVRFGFKDQNGDVQYMHQFIHNNSFTEAYMRSGNVPGRYEIENIGTPTYVPALAHWGTSIIMDGKFDDDKAYIFTASGTNLTLTGASSVTTSARPFSNSGPNASRPGFYSVYGGGGRYYYLGNALEVETPSAILNEVTAGTTITSTTGTGGLGGDSAGEAKDPYYSLSTYGGALPNSGPYQPLINVRWGSWPSYNYGIKSLLLINENPSSTKSQYQDYALGLTTQAATPLTAEYPLISIRLSPSVDTNAPGLLGEREVINRMQLALRQVGILSTHGVEIQLRMNGSIDNNNWQRVTTPSLSQLVYHSSTDTITGGNTIYSFRAQGGTGTTNRTAVLTDQDISEITYLGNSIMGGDNVFPDGPDILTIVAVLAEDVSAVSASNPWTISGRVSWAESQA